MRLVRMRKMRLGGLSVAMACLASVSMTAQSPYGWRGPERDGVYFENGLLKEWPSEGPELLWETMELGKGYSSPVIVDGRLYITGMDEEGTQEIFFAYSLDGKKLYQTAYGVPWTYHAYDREREGLCHQRIGRDRLLGYGRRQDRLESGRRQEVRAYDRKMGHVRVSAGLR